MCYCQPHVVGACYVKPNSQQKASNRGQTRRHNTPQASMLRSDRIALLRLPTPRQLFAFMFQLKRSADTQ